MLLMFRTFWFSPHCHRIPFKEIRYKLLLLIPAANVVLGILIVCNPEHISFIGSYPASVLVSIIATAIYQFIRWWRAPAIYRGTLGSLEKLAGRHPPPRSDYVGWQ